MFVRRFALVVSIVFCGSLAVAVVAVAAGGGMSPGKYTFHSTSADALFGMGKKGGPPAPSWNVSVNQGLNSFKPTHPGGPRTVTQSTMVFVSEFDANGNGGFGCFVVPDANFSVSRDLQQAALHTVLTTDELCPGTGAPVGGGKDVVFAGGGGTTLLLPISVDVTWTATGAVTTLKQSFSLQCLDYKQDGRSTNQSTASAASGTISALSGSLAAEFADINATDGQLNIRNTPQPACQGF